MNDIAKLREQTIEQWVGTRITPVASPADLLGQWDMRFAGPTGSDRVQWSYVFEPDGSVAVANEQWRWKLNEDGTLSLIVSLPPGPATDVAEDSEELVFPFQAADGRIILANDDTSVVEVLTKRPS